MENKDNPAEALKEYDRALALKPDFGAVHSERGSLYYQMGKPETALPDLQAAVAARPDDAVSLDRLGQTYLALDRPADAVSVLKRAAALNPEDSKMQLHLARALADNGQTAESKAAMDRFRQLGPVVNRAVPGGLVDYLSLTPEERRADYRRRVERAVREHPEDSAAQMDLLQLQLEDGDPKGAAQSAHRLAGLNLSADVLARAGRALLEAGLYAPARELLEKGGEPLALARAAFYGAGAAEGLPLLDRVPEPARGWDYYLARAEMLESAGKASEAAAALAKALSTANGQPAAYVQAGLYLLRKGRVEEAVRVTAASQDRQVMLVRAIALERSGASMDAQTLLEQVQNRWPEWAPAWAADGALLAAHGHRPEAITALRTAVALGAGKEWKGYLEELSAGGAGSPPDLVGLLRHEDRSLAVTAQ